MNIILQELKKIAVTLGILTLLLLPLGLLPTVGFARMGISLLFGDLYTLANFFLLGNICDKVCRKTPHQAKRTMQLHFFIRTLLAAVVVFASFKLPYLTPLGVIPPLFAPKLTYFAIGVYASLFHKHLK